MIWHSLRKRAIYLTFLLLVLAVPALAQVQSGNIYGTVLSGGDKSPLPGATVTLTGGGAPSIQTTDSQGKFRFLGLSPGTYSLKSEIEGFSPIDQDNVIVNIGRNTTVEILQPVPTKDTIVITEEAPLLDSLKQGPGQTVTLTDLEKIPTPRDPWSVLASTPGVLTDRINVGGNESGQQA